MLEELNIHNYALIDRVSVKFTRGLNILTGETGAGKSILVGALGLLMGRKADPSVIRTGAEESLVSGVINIKGNQEALNWIKAHSIRDEDGYLILRRLLKKTGRGSLYIGSIPVSRLDLEEFTTLVFDMHGQHDNQSLLNIIKHRWLLDRYAEIEEQVTECGKLFTELSSLRERYSRLITSEREQLRQIELLKHAVMEISRANLFKGEEAQLEKEHNILANHERLFRLVEAVYQRISESRSGALSQLRSAKDAMDEVVEIDPALSGLGNQLQDAFFEIEDFLESLRRYRERLAFDPEKLKAIEERLAVVHDLQKKYGDSIEEVLLYGEKCSQELTAIENSENDKQVLKEKTGKLEQELKVLSDRLSARRRDAAALMEKQVELELRKLGMPKVRFKVQVGEKRNEAGKRVYSQSGADLVEFLISPNQGEPFKPLKKIASGGEISRIMLALKSILAKADNISSLIFDEIDAGIGGEVAVAVGQSLKELSAAKQILCITHLATIAARADSHIKVKKEIKDNRTIASADVIKGEEIREEISRMLSGDYNDHVSLTHAGELLKKYGS